MFSPSWPDFTGKYLFLVFSSLAEKNLPEISSKEAISVEKIVLRSNRSCAFCRDMVGRQYWFMMAFSLLYRLRIVKGLGGWTLPDHHSQCTLEVSEMTYTVSSGMVNSTIPYRTVPWMLACTPQVNLQGCAEQLCTVYNLWTYTKISVIYVQAEISDYYWFVAGLGHCSVLSVLGSTLLSYDCTILTLLLYKTCCGTLLWFVRRELLRWWNWYAGVASWRTAKEDQFLCTEKGSSLFLSSSTERICHLPGNSGNPRKVRGQE